MGLIFEEISKLAQSDNYSYIYLSTNHTSVYEKYGFVSMTSEMELPIA